MFQLIKYALVVYATILFCNEFQTKNKLEIKEHISYMFEELKNYAVEQYQKTL